MRYRRLISGLAFFSNSLIVGCTLNTPLDDSSYRAVGNKSQEQLLSYTQKSAMNQAAQKTDIGKDSATSTGVPLPDFPGAMSKPNPKIKNSIDEQNHLIRYGQAQTIDKIVKTARIHCEPLIYKLNTSAGSFWGSGEGELTQCTYQFPKHCGSHLFSELTLGKKSILIFQPKKSAHYVIDTLSGTPKSHPGLWDIDDHLGSIANNTSYLLQNDYNREFNPQEFNPARLGWIIKASLADEKEFGELYHQAIQDIVKCF